MNDIPNSYGLMQKVATKAAEFMGSSIGELIKDGVHYLRWKTAHSILDRAEAILVERRTAGKKVLSLSSAVRFLDAASLEEDPTVQELWGRLLANAADPKYCYELDKTHVAILSEMKGLDAKVLEYVASQGWLQFKEVAASTGKAPLDRDEIAEALNVDKELIALALGNLWRLGCLLQEPTWKSGIGPSVAPNSSFRPSPLGFSLLKATKLNP